MKTPLFLKKRTKGLLAIGCCGLFTTFIAPAQQPPPQTGRPTADPDVLNGFINAVDSNQRKTADQAFSLNQANSELTRATIASDAEVAQAAQQVNSAARDAELSKQETSIRTNNEIQSESWGNALGNGLEKGIDSGAAAIGGAIGGGLNASSITDKK